MSTRHVLAFHLAIPIGIFAMLVAVGLSVGTAFVIGMMLGCGSMAVMMLRVDRSVERSNERAARPR